MVGGAQSAATVTDSPPPGEPARPAALRVRVVGRVPYAEAYALQRALHDRSAEDYLLVVEHPHVFTLGRHGDPANVLVDPAEVGAELVRTDRGGDVTYHGPGQLVVYPILTVPFGSGAIPGHVDAMEQIVIDTLDDLGLRAGRLSGFPGVWVDADGPNPRKICAVGTKVARGRSMHGLALNVHPDLTWFERIVPCGITGKAVTSLAAEGVDCTVGEVAEVLIAHAADRWGDGRAVDRQGVDWSAARAGGDRARGTDHGASFAPTVVTGPERGAGLPGSSGPSDVPGSCSSSISSSSAPGTPAFDSPQTAPDVRLEPRADAGGASPEPRSDSRDLVPEAAPGVVGDPVVLGPTAVPGERGRRRLRQAGVDPDAGLSVSARKPQWLRVPAVMGSPYLALDRTVRRLGLVTVCEEAGCPNIFECWADGTATFMINGERCTRSCGFCLVDTRKPLPPDPGEPERVAVAVAELGLAHAVVTAVARDDLPDGGAGGFAATIAAIRRHRPGTTVEVLVPDCRGDVDALAAILSAGPDVLNHNLETVARLHRAVRPSAGYARSLALLARAKDRGITTKSGMMVGLGERTDELIGALHDLRSVGVDIVTLGQYLRPTAHHLPVARWWSPDEIAEIGAVARSLGFAHVEASPLTRSSYHARRGAVAAGAGRDVALLPAGEPVSAGPSDRAVVPGGGEPA